MLERLVGPYGDLPEAHRQAVTALTVQQHVEEIFLPQTYVTSLL